MNAYAVALARHPQTPGPAVRSIDARVDRLSNDALALAYAVEGDFNSLLIPPPAPSHRGERLWEHTCFEVFITARGERAYYEFNFAPSGAWAAYAFRSYRDGEPVARDDVATDIAARHHDHKLELDATAHLGRLVSFTPRARLRIALAAVIEDKRGARSYWALKHPPGKPDFHHPESFALELEPWDLEVTADPTRA